MIIRLLYPRILYVLITTFMSQTSPLDTKNRERRRNRLLCNWRVPLSTNGEESGTGVGDYSFHLCTGSGLVSQVYFPSPYPNSEYHIRNSYCQKGLDNDLDPNLPPPFLRTTVVFHSNIEDHRRKQWRVPFWEGFLCAYFRLCPFTSFYLTITVVVP